MQAHNHILVGVAASIAPDAILVLFGWREKWLPETHRLVRIHRFLHSPKGLVWIFFLCYTLHIIIDWFSPHRSSPSDQ